MYKLFICTKRAVIEISHHFNEMYPSESKPDYKIDSDNLLSFNSVFFNCGQEDFHFFLQLLLRLSYVQLCRFMCKGIYSGKAEKARNGFPISVNFCLICQKVRKSRLSHRKLTVVTILNGSHILQIFFSSFLSAFSNNKVLWTESNWGKKKFSCKINPL